jgi:hypothetical protein
MKLEKPPTEKAFFELKRKLVKRPCAEGCGKGRTAPLSFCGMCLRNRHGEDIDTAVAAGTWQCPRCRGSCGDGCKTCCNCGEAQSTVPATSFALPATSFSLPATSFTACHVIHPMVYRCSRRHSPHGVPVLATSFTPWCTGARDVIHPTFHPGLLTRRATRCTPGPTPRPVPQEPWAVADVPGHQGGARRGL